MFLKFYTQLKGQPFHVSYPEYMDALIIYQCFYIESRENLSDDQITTIKQLINYTNQIASPTNFTDYIEIGPRLNYATSFSTNVLDIFKYINIQGITRFEKSLVYNFVFQDGFKGDRKRFIDNVLDRMIQQIYPKPLTSFDLIDFETIKPAPIYEVDVMNEGLPALQRLNEQLGLGFDSEDLKYNTRMFVEGYKRNPTNVECFDLAQSNSEHCRHWFFKGAHVIDGIAQTQTLMQMVQGTQSYSNPNNVIQFSDNSSGIRGFAVSDLLASRWDGPSPYKSYFYAHNTGNRNQIDSNIDYDIIFTAETHNFPTGVSPFEGAATGIGGRQRDVQATGRGALTLAGTAGYAVSHLNIPDYNLPWESDFMQTFAGHGLKNDHLAPALRILIEASNGASDYGNKYGEPIICGFTRSFCTSFVINIENNVYSSTSPILESEKLTEKFLSFRAWLKPIMFTGGLGLIPHAMIRKVPPQNGMRVAKIGGPVYKIGMGGGAASSKTTSLKSSNKESKEHVLQNIHQNGMTEETTRESELDFQAVQRGDPEMQQKLYRATKACALSGMFCAPNCNPRKEHIKCPENELSYMGDLDINSSKNLINPIQSIHDQGAGGNGNVLKEIVDPLGAYIDLKAFSCADSSCGPLEVWTAEYQESNAILLPPKPPMPFEDKALQTLQSICKREKCPLNIVGQIDAEKCKGFVIFGSNSQNLSFAYEKTHFSTNYLKLPSSEATRKKIIHSSLLIEPYMISNDFAKVIINNRQPNNTRMMKVKCANPPNPILIYIAGLQCGKQPYNINHNPNHIQNNFNLQSFIGGALNRVLRQVAVGSKRFLTNKVDRSVSGLIARQQCCGPLQTPLSDCGCVALSHFPQIMHNSAKDEVKLMYPGSITTIGECPIKVLHDNCAGPRMALGEALTNMVGNVPISALKDCKCSVNWMWPAKCAEKDGNSNYESALLYRACESLCLAMQDIGVAIDGGKDSLSMAVKATYNQTKQGKPNTPQQEKNRSTIVKSPGSVVVSMYAPVPDISYQITPGLKPLSYLNKNDYIVWIPFNQPRKNGITPKILTRLGGSAFYQSYGLAFNAKSKTYLEHNLRDTVKLSEYLECPDMEYPKDFAAIFNRVQDVLKEHPNLIRASHDISDGGLIGALLEMVFGAEHCLNQIEITIPLQNATTYDSIISFLFAEELGLLVQIRESDFSLLSQYFEPDYQIFRIAELHYYSLTDIKTCYDHSLGIRKIFAPNHWEVLKQCLLSPQSSNDTNYANINLGSKISITIPCELNDENIFGPLPEELRHFTIYEQFVTELLCVWEATSYQLERIQIPGGTEFAKKEFQYNLLHFLYRQTLSARHSNDNRYCCGKKTRDLRNNIDYHSSVNLKALNQHILNYRILGQKTPPINLNLTVIRVALIREEGTNGDKELASALYLAGFEVWDFTMTDLLTGNFKLNPNDFRGLVFPGGFSYGDVLGSAKGWSATIQHNPEIRKQFWTFFRTPSTFSLGICNGCQLLARLGWLNSNDNECNDLLSPKLEYDVTLEHNDSGRFESRWVTLSIPPKKQENSNESNIFTRGMEGSILGCWVAHGEGKFEIKLRNHQNSQEIPNLMRELVNLRSPIRYVDFRHQETVAYPANPNGSLYGVAAICSPCGRHMGIMPHPERSVMFWQWPYLPSKFEAWTKANAIYMSPWMKLFTNAYDWCQNIND